MQKLIKLNDQHYIIVDDSEIKVGDWYLTFMNNKIIGEPRKCSDDSYNFSNCKKITHSTQPLGTPLLFTNAFESELSLSINGLNETFIENWGCKKLSLSEVEEAINGYSVEKMAQSAFTHPDFGEYKVGSIAYYNGYKDGFNAHKELVKDNFILSEDDLHRILDMARLQGEESFLVKHTNEEIIQSLLPKTEWDITIDEQGKIKLI